jgi:hypothetical protein
MYKAVINVIGPLEYRELDDVKDGLEMLAGWSPYAASTGTSMGSAVLRCLATLRHEHKPSHGEYMEWVADAMDKLKTLSDHPLRLPAIGDGLRDCNKVFYAVVYLVPVKYGKTSKRVREIENPGRPIARA